MMEQHVGIFRSPQGSRYCLQNASIKFEIWKCQFWRSCHSANTQLCWPCRCCNFENDQRTLGPASYPNGTMQGFPLLVKFPGKIKEDFHDETLKRRHLAAIMAYPPASLVTYPSIFAYKPLARCTPNHWPKTAFLLIALYFIVSALWILFFDFTLSLLFVCVHTSS